MKKTLSIKSKFFFSMLLSSIFIILLLILSTNSIFLYFFTAEEAKNSKKELDYISQQLDFFVSSVDNYSRSIISDPTLQETAHSYKRDASNFESQQANEVKNTINHIIQTTDYIHSVTFYDLDCMYITSTALHPSTRMPKSFTDIDPNYWVATQKKSNQPPFALISTFSYMRPFYSYSTGEHLGYLEIAVRESAINDIFNNPLSNTNSIYIINNEGTILSTNSDIPIGMPYKKLRPTMFQNDTSVYYDSDVMIFTKSFPSLGWYIISEVSVSSFLNPIYVILAICIGVGILCLIIYVPLAHSISTSITAPLHQLIKHTQTIKAGDWKPIILEESSTEDMHLLFNAFNSMILAQETLKNELLETQKTKNKLSLDLLQEQINPHFLYNTLDNICALAEIGETETLIHMVINLSTFYRKALSKGHTYITVAEELTIIRTYLSIMQVRYYNKFDFTINCEADLFTCPCIKLLLQPIVENSIYHGIKKLPHKGFISIVVKRDLNNIIFIIEDNGVGIEENLFEKIWSSHENHFGIKNIHQRIQLYYGENYGLTIKNRPNGGCITQITIAHKEGLSYEY